MCHVGRWQNFGSTRKDIDNFIKQVKKQSLWGSKSALDPISAIVEGIYTYLTITEINHFSFTHQYDILF